MGTGPFRGILAIVSGFGLVAAFLWFLFTPVLSLIGLIGVLLLWTLFLWGVGWLELPWPRPSGRTARDDEHADDDLWSRGSAP